MRAGLLKHRVTIKTPTRVADGMGGFTVTWTDVATVWAAIWPLKGQEKIESMKLEHEITHRIRMRYRSDVTYEDRLLYKTRTFRVIDFRNIDESDVQLEVLAKEES